MTFVDDERLKHLVSLVAQPVVIANRFELGDVLGEGGMGIVYEAWDAETERSVALKVLRRTTNEPSTTSALDAARAARFAREANSLAQISDPGVVEYVTHGVSAEGDHYLAMELLVGETLAERLTTGRLSVNEAILVGHGIATALATVHDHALVHRDVKPENLFLQEGDLGRVKLLDFGLVRANGAPSVTRTGSLVGTPSYMAPEQVRAESPPETRSDLFALGSVLFECLTGRAAFVSDDTEGLLMKVLVEEPPPVSAFCPDVPAALNALVAQLMAAEPSRRPVSASAVATALADLLPDAALAETEPRTARTDHATLNTLIAGKYRVERELGRGGMGVVLLARHEALDRYVALKLLNCDHDVHGRAVARLAREARATSALTSEHVARVMDVDTHDDGTPFIVMEYLRGKDLGQHLAEHGRLSVSDSVDYVLQAIQALAEAHSLGIVHRDLKPSNLFLTTSRDGTPLVKVLDFGISKLSQLNDADEHSRVLTEGSITAPDAVLGSPSYMSPEQLQNTKQVDARTDIWSIGVVLYQLLSGRLPFEADSVMALGAKIAAGTPADLRRESPDVPVGLTLVVLRCLEKSPADRFSNVTELAQALLPYIAQSPPASARPVDNPPVALSATKRRANGVRTVAIAVLAATALGVGATMISTVASDSDSNVSSTASAAPSEFPALDATVAWSQKSPEPTSSAPDPTSAAPSLEAPQTSRSSSPSLISAPPGRASSESDGQRRRHSRGPKAAATTPPASNVLDPMNPALLER